MEESRMYLKEEEIERFRGTGENNKAGEDLKTFLANYDPDKYKNPCNTVDTIVFTYSEKDGKRCINKVLLIKRGNHPSIGWWACPGGFVEYMEDIDAAALRELQEETGIEGIEAVQLKSYGKYDRDPRTRIITTAYVALVPEGSIKAEAGDDASDSDWFSICDEFMNKYTDENGISHEQHRLVLDGTKQPVHTVSVVEITWKEGAVLESKNYTVKETNLLAADHGAMILEAYHFVCRP
jgi:8-oxo-dGTP diphosphatase